MCSVKNIYQNHGFSRGFDLKFTINSGFIEKV